MSTLSKVDVLIVGGGPVGLLAANLVLISGLSVKIVDIEAEPQHWGRGDWVQGRTLELLELLGLATDLLQTGAQVDTMAVHQSAKSIRLTMPFVPDSVVTKHKHLLCVGQHITESSLQHSLAEADIQVERPVTVSEFTTDDDGSGYPLVATLQNVSTGDTWGVRAKYLLGCDGAHSDIRKQLDIQLEGQTTCMNSGVLDALVQTNFPDKKILSFVQGPLGSADMFPRENNLTRIMVRMPENAGDRNRIQLQDIQTAARRAFLPHRVEFLAVLWWTVYSVGQHVAEHYFDPAEQQHPRVFLCGDACHSQSPTLGQGLNTGFGDVFNLIWKIAFVEQGLAQPSFLSTYESERRPVAQQVIAIDKVIAKASQGIDPNTDGTLLDLIRPHQLFNTGFGITYRDPSDESTDLQPGDRAPDFKVVVSKTGSKVRLYDLWREAAAHTPWRFHLLLLAKDLTRTAATINAFCDTLAKKPWADASNAKPWLQLQVISTTTQNSIIQACELDDKVKQTILIDKINHAQCHHGYGVGEEPMAVLIRPDLYIGWMGSVTDVDSLEAWFSGFMNL